jgi:hypothetical protein
LTVNVDTPTAVGMPAITPLEERERREGRAPEVIAQVYGGTPPAAASVCEYAAPAMPDGKGEVVVITSGGGLMVSVKVWLAEAAALVTVTPNVEVPGVVGVPEIRPKEVNEMPGGSAPEVICHSYGGDAGGHSVSCCEYAVPVTPEGRTGFTLI